MLTLVTLVFRNSFYSSTSLYFQISLEPTAYLFANNNHFVLENSWGAKEKS